MTLKDRLTTAAFGEPPPLPAPHRKGPAAAVGTFGICMALVTGGILIGSLTVTIDPTPATLRGLLPLTAYPVALCVFGYLFWLADTRYWRKQPPAGDSHAWAGIDLQRDTRIRTSCGLPVLDGPHHLHHGLTRLPIAIGPPEGATCIECRVKSQDMARCSICRQEYVFDEMVWSSIAHSTYCYGCFERLSPTEQNGVIPQPGFHS